MSVNFARLAGVFILVVLVTGFPCESSAQSVQGRVLDENRMPLPGTQIVIPTLNQGTVSDEKGRYFLDHLEPGTYVVEYRFIGYKSEIRTIEMKSEIVVLDVQMVPENVYLDEAVITAEHQKEAMLKRSTQSVTVLRAADLDSKSGLTLGETLKDLPGVTTLSTGPSISKPVIRGLHSQRLVVLNAGVAQEGQQWGGEHAPEIDPFAMARIEVIKGAAGVEHGVGAIGGVIRLDPPDLPTNESISGRLMLSAFSNNRQGAGSLALQGGPKAIRGFGWRLQGSMRRAGDSQTPDWVIGNSAFQEFDGSVSLGIERDSFHLHAYYSHFGTTLGLFKGAHIGNMDDLLAAIERGHPSVKYTFSYEIKAPKQTINHDLVTIESQFRLDSGDWIEAQYGLQSNRREEYDAHCRFCDEPGKKPAFGLSLTTHTLDLKLRQKPRGKFLGVIGLSGMNQTNTNNETGYLIPNFKALTGGIYTRQTWVQGPLTLESGIRYNYRWMEAFPRNSVSSGEFTLQNHTYSSLTAVVGAVWQFSDHWSLASNLGSAWRPPGVNELYNFGVHHGTAQFETGDPTLGGERNYNVDLTLRHVAEHSVAEISVYNNQMNGYIYLHPQVDPVVTIRGTFPAFIYSQTNAVLRGIDGLLSHDFGDRFGMSVVGSMVRGRDTKSNDHLISMPSDRLTLNGYVSLPTGTRIRESEFHVETLLVRKQNRFPTEIELVEPPSGYALLGAGFKGAFFFGPSLIRFSLDINNIANVAYRDYLSRFRYFVDDPGRNISFRLQLPFGRS